MKKLIVLTMTLVIALTSIAQFSMGDCSGAENSNNPYDSIGLKHNANVEFLMNDVNPEDLSDFSITFTSNLGYAESTFGSTEVTNLQSSNALTQVEELINALKNTELPTVGTFLENCGVPSNSSMYPYLESIVTYIYENPNDTYTQMKEHIVIWEDSIGVSGLETSDQLALYAFGSTLRYSLLGWSNSGLMDEAGNIGSNGSNYAYLEQEKIGNAGSGPSLNYVNYEEKAYFGWLRRLVTAISDAVGGLIGALGSGPAGAVIIGAGASAISYGVATLNGW